MARHAEAVPSGLPFDPDWAQYRRCERLGTYKGLAAFVGGQLVGYNAFWVQPTMQHRSVKQALNEALYLEPEHRRGLAGARLIRDAETWLREMGVRRIVYYAHPDLNPRSTDAKLAELLRRLGYLAVETAHAKQL